MDARSKACTPARQPKATVIAGLQRAVEARAQRVSIPGWGEAVSMYLAGPTVRLLMETVAPNSIF